MTIISEEYLLQKYKDVICNFNKNIKYSIKSLDEHFDIHLVLYFWNRLFKSYKSREEYFYFFYFLFFIFNFFYFLLFIFLFFILSPSKEDILSEIHLSGSPQFQRRIMTVCQEFRTVFGNTLT